MVHKRECPKGRERYIEKRKNGGDQDDKERGPSACDCQCQEDSHWSHTTQAQGSLSRAEETDTSCAQDT